ncbi:hypothetical protein L6R53_18730 [Myxococcota bacterium]|nr:hypothetical protein [Myxococcota bacterium]
MILPLLAAAACGSPGLETTVDTSALDAPPGILRVEPAGLYDFGRLSPEAPRARGELRLWVEGGTPVRVTELHLDGSSSSAFTLPDELPLPVELGPGEEALLGVYFEPFAAGQYFGDVVVVMVEEGQERELTLALQGEGCVDVDADEVCD